MLPEKLLHEIQKYVKGEIIYIPKEENDKFRWGIKNGSKKNYEQRNRNIKELKSSGMSIDEIAKAYYLSPESIRKILYDQKSV